MESSNNMGSLNNNMGYNQEVLITNSPADRKKRGIKPIIWISIVVGVLLLVGIGVFLWHGGLFLPKAPLLNGAIPTTCLNQTALNSSDVIFYAQPNLSLTTQQFKASCGLSSIPTCNSVEAYLTVNSIDGSFSRETHGENRTTFNESLPVGNYTVTCNTDSFSASKSIQRIAAPYKVNNNTTNNTA